ncbi:helix-turn-helix transcriptional regulator [Roseicyclus persicicus]|uniref:WYL domain-containing protein n=1 Tax=Roseicyclus persicicus TaxID=2650661 RepID=A0A7X6GWP9_9RHOB|nr:WYL domain-containing protein [Roseibacterium persicicum]NKX43787.1 WYL domain-containing protein [Roseibacterium persicicum]
MTARDRQDAILRHLRRSGSATVAALAGEVGASRRTVLRDIGALREQGFLIRSDCGRGGGVHLDPSSLQRTARLTVTEVFALLISVAAMRAAGSLPFAGLADAGLAKIERSLRPDAVRDLRRLLDCLHVGRLSPLQDLSTMGAMDDALLPAFEAAFLGQRHLRFAYRDAKGAETRREVEPQALLILPPLWYLVAWDPARGDFRRFRMDRISAPELVEARPFRRRHVPFDQDVCPYRALGRSPA